jgi:hypothetical protein
LPLAPLEGFGKFQPLSGSTEQCYAQALLELLDLSAERLRR